MFRSIVLLFAVLPGLVAAQDRTPSHCLAFAEHGPKIHYASTNDALHFDEVRITYVDHSMYMIDSYGGLKMVTDFNGLTAGSDRLPDLVTMNRGHSSHYTDYLAPEISHVLRGWDPGGGVADHNLDLGEVLVRNITTDIRSPWGGGQVPDGNSIFVFEMAGLCIGHLGHLHHVPTDEQYAQLGRLDVVMVAVDGGLTLDIPSVLDIMQRLRAQVVLPMHWFGRGSLDSFLFGMSDRYGVKRLTDNSFKISLDLLPDQPEVWVVPPIFASSSFGIDD